MINWKDIKGNIPTNVGKQYPNNPETPFVSCLVWVCNPSKLKGGVTDVVRWDTENGCWLKSDMRKWFYEGEYVITHFCDEINVPTEDTWVQN